MAKRTVIDTWATDAVLIAAAVSFSIKGSDFRQGTKPSVTIVGLATTETATIIKNGEIVRNGVIDHANEGSVTLESAGVYGIYKDATAATVDVVVENAT